MARWTIYDKNGNVKAITSGITFGSRTLPDLEYSGTWMDRKFVTISVKSEQPVNWQIGDFLIYRGEKFVLDYDPSVVKKARKNTYGEGFVYDSIKFNSLDTEMADVQFLDEVLSDNHIHYTSLPTFSFFAATIDDYADRLQANMNRYCLQNNFLLSEWWLILTPSRTRTVARGAGVSGLSAKLGAAWDAAYHDEPSTDGEKFNQNVSISQSTVLAGLSNIYNIFGLHYVTSGRTLIIGAAGKIASHVFEYGKGNGLYEIERVADSEQQIVTKLYAYGNSTNLPIRYYSNMAKVCVGKVLSVQKVKHHRETARLYIHTDVPYSDSYFTGEIGIIPRAIVYIRSYGVTIIGGIIEQADGYIQVDVFLKTSEGDPDWHTTDSEGFATIAQNIKEGDEIVFVEGVDVDKWPTGHFSYIGDETVIPDNLAVNNLMLPGFPTQSLKDWCLAHGGTENQDGTVTWHGHTAFLSEEALAPYILSPNSAALGIREASKTWDGNDDTEDIYPTIENTGDDILLSSDIITDNGVFGEGDTIPNFSVVVKGLGDDVELNNLIAQSGESAKISMKDGYCGGREFSVVSAEKVEGGNWKLTLKRDYDESLQLYFPYSNNAAIGHTPVADEAYQLRGADIEGYDGDKYVWLGIDMPSEYIESSAEKLLDSALTFLEANDYTRYTYSPKVDDIYMAEQHNSAIESQSTNRPFDSLHDTIHEGDLMQFCDEDLMIDGNIYIDKLTIKEYGNGEIPTYDITLKNHKSVGTLQKILNTVDSLNGNGGVGGSGGISTSQAKTLIRQEGDNRYIRRDIDDETDTDVSVNNIIGKQAVVSDKLRPLSGDTVEIEGNADIRDSANVGGNLSVNGNALVKGDTRLQQDLTFGTEGSTDDFVQNEKGCAIYWDGSSWVVEADCMNIHKKLYAKTIQVDEVTHVGGENILSDASCIADAVIPYSQNGTVVFWRVLFRRKNGEGKTVYNRWKRGDMAYCQVFNVQAGTTSDFENKYYWRKVIGTNLSPNPKIENDSFSSDEYHYIDLSNQAGEFDNAGVMRVDVNAGSIPAAEDPIIQVGYIASPNDDPATVIERQGVTIVSGGGQYKRSILMWEGIGGGTNPWTFPEPKVKLSPYDVRIIANKFLIKTDYGVTYQPPINRGVWANLPPETGQSDNLHRCYKDDIVQHNGATWICTYIQGSGQPAYTTEEPSDNAVNWQVYAQKGTSNASLVISDPMIVVNADSSGRAKTTVDKTVTIAFKVGDTPTVLVDSQSSGVTGVPAGVQAELNYVVDSGILVQATVRIRIPYNNSTFPSTLTVTLSGIDPTTGLTRTAQGAITLVAQKEGVQGEHGINSATVMLYKRSASEPTDKPTTTLYYKFADGKLYTTSALDTEATTQLNGWSTSIPSGSNPCYVRQVAALSNADYDAIDVSEWGDVKKLVENGANGANGSNTATIMLYKRSSTTISSVGISVTLYYKFSDKVLYTDSACTTPATTQLNGWSRTIPTNSTNPIYVTSAIAYSADVQDAIGSNEWVAPAKFTENGAPGSDAINPTLTPDSVIVNQDMTKDVTTQQDTTSIDLSEAYTDVKVYLGRTDVSSNATVTSVSATHCEAEVDQNNPRRVKITKIARYYDSEAERYYFYDEGSVNITVTYNGTPYTLNFKFYANLLGTYKTKIESDVKEEVAETKYWTYDKDGRPLVQVNVGDFIHSSSQNTSKLEETVGDPEDPTSGTLVYRTSAIEQHVDRIDLYVAEGSNLHPNPTFANYNPYTNGTNHETGTLVGSVEYGSTIGNYTSIWAAEGANLVALKVLTNTTTAATVLYANNSPTDNPRIRLTAGKTYTWSVLVAGDLDMIASASSLVKGSLYNSETGDQQQSSGKYIRANSPVLWKDTTWKQLYSTFEIPANSEYVWFSWIPFIAVLAGATGRIVYGGIRLEEGTKPTIINYNGTEDKLVKTGIDITKRTIQFTTDNFIVENNDGEKTAWLDENGNLGTSGNIFTGMAVINSLAKMQRFMPYDEDAYPDGFSLISHSVQRSGLTFLSESQALVPDVFNLTDLVMIEDDYYGSSVHGNEPVQIVFPFIIPYEVVNHDGDPYDTGTPYFKADILLTKTTYKNTDSHFVTADEMAMLIDREFSVFFDQGSRYYHIILPSFTRDANGYVTANGNVPAVSYVGYAFSDIGGVTIHYEHLMFKFMIDSNKYICDGVAPVLKYTEGSGSSFKYRVLDL